MSKAWMICVSKDHAERGIELGVCQACHGKRNPLTRLKRGDVVILYSGKVVMGEPALCQAFTAIGRLIDEEPYQVDMTPDFCPYRRRVSYYKAREAPIRPLIPVLTFIRDKDRWGYPFRFGFFEIPVADAEIIAEAMGVAVSSFDMSTYP
jgi:hypothetical protein